MNGPKEIKIIMRNLKIIYILFLFHSSMVWAGGATSGGGHDVGLQVKRVVSILSAAIQNIPSSAYPIGMKDKMLLASQKARVAVVPGPLPAVVEKTHRLQIGAAFSTFDGKETYLIEVDYNKWPLIEDPTVEEGILYHEIAVMAGLETTSDYTYTDRFLKDRKKLWEKIFSEKFYCVVSLVQHSNASHPKLLGSVLLFDSDPTSIRLNWSALTHLQKRSDGKNTSLVLQWVFGANGYLRTRLIQAETELGPGDFKIFWDAKEILPQALIHSPYDAIEPHAQNSVRQMNGYQLMSSCSKEK